MIDYLASPYTHADPAMMQWRYEQVVKKTVELMDSDFNIFSPIVHSHPLVLAGLDVDHEAWLEIDREHIARCDRTLVLTLPLWNKSKGVLAEIAYSREIGHKISLIHPGPGIVLQPYPETPDNMIVQPKDN